MSRRAYQGGTNFQIRSATLPLLIDQNPDKDKVLANVYIIFHSKIYPPLYYFSNYTYRVVSLTTNFKVGRGNTSKTKQHEGILRTANVVWGIKYNLNTQKSSKRRKVGWVSRYIQSRIRVFNV